MSSDQREEDRRGSLSRERVITVALGLVQRIGLEGLSMRTLADALGIKAPSLYWHVRDRDELLRQVATAMLGTLQLPAEQSDWRDGARGICESLRQALIEHRDAARLFLSLPDVLADSAARVALTGFLRRGGLSEAAAAETAIMLLAWVLVDAQLGQPSDAVAPEDGEVAQLDIDSGSRGVSVRAGPGLRTLARQDREDGFNAPLQVRGNQVVVRSWRGGRGNVVELRPSVGWRIRVHGSTWNTRLDLCGLDVREILVDSGASRLDCVLPPASGVVPIEISSGVAGVQLRRPPGTAVTAHLHSGSLQVRLDQRLLRATANDVSWESTSGATLGNHYALVVHSGVVRVSLEEDPSIAVVQPAPSAPVPARAGLSVAIDVVLDGVAAAPSSLRGLV